VAALSLIPHPAPDAAALVDGRVSIRIPADWSVERITGGPGSDRLHAAAPGGSPSLHLTQSTGDAATTPQQLAETLRAAMRSEAVGVFTDLAATATDDGRPAVTYREHRAGATTVWTVVLAGEVRIALGCQTPDEDVPEVCAEAVRSAHAIR
jgi:type VII secretion-associated protein (TIGR03931 family)